MKRRSIWDCATKRHLTASGGGRRRVAAKDLRIKSTRQYVSVRAYVRDDSMVAVN